MKKTNRLLLCTAAIVITGIIAGCSKNNSGSSTVSPGTQQVLLYMTDGPGFFDHVYIDIQKVQVLVDTCSDNDDDTSKHHGWAWGWNNHQNDNADSCKLWETLDIRAGVYDILSFRNGLDTLFAQGVIPEGKIRKIKISLGTNNSLVKDSITYPITIPGNNDAVIVINLRGDEWEEFETRHHRLWMDFDIGRSIVWTRDNIFILNPFIHCFIDNTTGRIKGTITPMAAFPVLTLYNNSDTAYALPNRNGDFKLRGLPAGEYSLFVNASNGYKDTTISNITVTAGKEIKLDVINLHK